MKAQAGSTGRGAGRTYRKQTGDGPAKSFKKAAAKLAKRDSAPRKRLEKRFNNAVSDRPKKRSR